jgi:hypothetical protein
MSLEMHLILGIPEDDTPEYELNEFTKMIMVKMPLTCI